MPASDLFSRSGVEVIVVRVHLGADRRPNAIENRIAWPSPA
jgi:hypothetical protein